jgi:uncharacterized protein YwgA
MSIDKHRWLAAVIAAHPNRQVIGRTRLQKTIRLLQRLGLPTDYTYSNYFYGPYSEDLQADLGLLEQMGLITEELHRNRDESATYYVETALPRADLAEIEPFRPHIESLSQTDAVVLELAATYDAFRSMGFDHEESLQRIRRKKGPKCGDGREQQALDLLQALGLLDLQAA